MKRTCKQFLAIALTLVLLTGLCLPVAGAAGTSRAKQIVEYGSFDVIGQFFDGEAFAFRSKSGDTKEVGLLDTAGHFTKIGNYEFVDWHIPYDMQNLLMVMDGRDQVFVITKSGKTYDYGFFVEETPEYLYVINGDKMGVADAQGNLLINCQYSAIIGSSTGVFSAVLGTGTRSDPTRCGLVDKTGKEITGFIYEDIGLSSNGLTPVMRDGYWGFIDKTGKLVVDCIYSEVYAYTEGLAAVSIDIEAGKWSYITKEGKPLLDFIYDEAYVFQENRACVGLMDSDGFVQYGFIDGTGKRVIDCIYDNASGFCEGLAVVGKVTAADEIEYGAIDPAGKVVIPIQYTYLEDFVDGVAVAYTKWTDETVECVCIDKTGTPIHEGIYNYVPYRRHGFLVVLTEDGPDSYLLGLLDVHGTEMLSMSYEDLAIGDGGLITTVKNGQYGVLQLLPGLAGDADGSGNITVMDMMAIKRHILRKESLAGENYLAGDADGDGAISVLDMMTVKRAILGK